MNEQSNIFLRILQIGADRKGKTISFNEIISLINKEFKISDDMTPIIRRWFYDYFYTKATFRKKRGVTASDLIDYELTKHDGEEAYFTGDGFFKYYEYLEVKKAYENAETATRQAKRALCWVIVAFVSSVVIGLVQILLMII